jgi:post-segregation antitoxin (ccd killing protein)
MVKYVFKPRTCKKVIVDANNLEQAKRFFLENNVVINVNKKKQSGLSKAYKQARREFWMEK